METKIKRELAKKIGLLCAEYNLTNNEVRQIVSKEFFDIMIFG